MSIWNELIQAARVAQIPAPALRPVTLAQWILESGRGTSELARLHYNFAGLKWREEMTGYATKIRYVAHDGPDDYCAFTSPDAFIQGTGGSLDAASMPAGKAMPPIPPAIFAS